MAFITVKKEGSSIIADFGVYSLFNGVTKRSYSIHDVTKAELYNPGTSPDESFVDVFMGTEPYEEWRCTYDTTYEGSELFIVESIDAGGSPSTPSSNEDLFALINLLRG